MTGIGSWRIIFSGVIGGFFMASIFKFWGANPFMELNPMHQLCIGGFMFAIVFMAKLTSFYVTLPWYQVLMKNKLKDVYPKPMQKFIFIMHIFCQKI